MARPLLATAAIVAALHALFVSPAVRAQDAVNKGGVAGEAVLTKLSPVVFPLIARTAHITGEVVVDVTVAQDGTVLSATIVNGPPLLANSTLESVKKSQFECRNCGIEPTKIRLTYAYSLLPPPQSCDSQADPAESAKADDHLPQVAAGSARITIVDHFVMICDPVTKIRTRSWKCFYLWHCASK